MASLAPAPDLLDRRAISPELVLVDPELSAAASELLALPARWDVARSDREAQAPRTRSFRAGGTLQLALAAAVAVGIAIGASGTAVWSNTVGAEDAGPASSAAPPSPTSHPLTHPRPSAPAATGAPAQQAQTTTARHTTTGSAQPAKVPALPPAKTTTARTATSAPARTTTSVAAAQTRTTVSRGADQTKAGSAGAKSAAQPRLVAGSGYVFGDGGRFHLASNARSVVGMTLTLRCGGTATIPPLPLTSRLSFTFDGLVRSTAGPVTLSLDGRFVTAAAAEIAVQERGGSCGAGTRHFSAHLS
jgi:hypothetical protein